MDMRRAMDRAEDDLCRQYNEGVIDEATFHEEMRALAREQREMAEEAAQDAYDREIGRW